jgi:uncharacterized iron-regulated membrane protein
MPPEQVRDTEEPEGTPPGGDRDTGAEANRRTSLRPLLWRLHFLGGVLIAPVVVWLALTGILYAWHPQIEAVLHQEALTAQQDGPASPLAEQVAAAQGEYPEWHLHAVTPADGAQQQTTGVTLVPPAPDGDGDHGHFGPPPGAVTVYVDPASAAITGEITEENRPDRWLRTLHSSAHIGPGAEPLTELAASWALVALLTGLYLWWPRSRQALRRTLRFRGSPRVRWRSIHTTAGVVSCVLLLALIATGLTWTNYAGSWFGQLRTHLSAETPQVSTDLAAGGQEADAHDHHEHHGDDAGHHAEHTADPGDIDGVHAAALSAGLEGVLEIEPPHEPGQAWTARLSEREWPVQDTTVAIDPTGCVVTDRVDWEEHPLLGKATTVGIAFHEGELFGNANRVLLTLLAVTLVLLIAAGYRMWWLRRPSGGIGALPPLGPLLRTAPLPLLVGFALLLVLLPTLGVALVVYLAIEWIVRGARGRAVRSP